MRTPMHAGWFTFLPMLALGALCVWSGWHFGRRVEVRREPAGREALAGFEGELRRELDRLAHLYESHLRRVAAQAGGGSQPWLRREAERVIGIRQVSLLAARTERAGEFDLEIGRGAGSPPRPFIEGYPRQLATVPVPALRGPDAPDAVWVDEPGKPLIFCQKVGDHIAAILVAPEAVAAAMSSWLREQKGEALRELPIATWALEGPDGASLARHGALPEQPADVLLPVHTRFGTWKVRAWDPIVTQVSWHAPTLAGAASGAVLFALLGAGLYFQQRGALRRAEQRVSFVNHVSHELRAPLTNILLNLDIARESLDANEAARRLELVQEEARRLGRLIDNVLTFSRREQGPLRLAPQACSPASVLSAVVDQFAPSFARRGLEVRCRRDGESEPCLLDADALAQILANLLSNVEKYVPGGAVEIAVSREGETLAITVADTGPGIPPAEAERLFRPFERLDGRVSEGATGTGLGLGIARDLAASMGGSLQLVPSARGSSFELRVPAPRAAPLSAVPAA